MESEEQLAEREERYVLEKLREIGINVQSLAELCQWSLDFEQCRFLERFFRLGTRHDIESSRVRNAIMDALPKAASPTEADQQEVEKEASELVKKMREAGLELNQPYDLLDTTLSEHRAAIEPLVELFRRVKTRYLKETIARGLADRAARGIAEDALLEEWFRTPLKYENLTYLWTLGMALSKVATDKSFETIGQILRDKRYASARQELTLFLVRAKDPRAVRILHELIEDDDVTVHVIEAMGKRKDAKSAAAVEKLGRVCTWDWAFARKSAKKLLKKWGELSGP